MFEQVIYQESLKDYWDLKNAIDTAFDEGKEEGRIEGEQIGLEKGEQIGLEKGKMEMALNMLAEKLPLELISKVTGLSIEVIRQIAEQRRKP